MRFRYQLEQDDCFRTVLACMLDLEPQEVPHYMPEGVGVEAWERVNH